MKLFCKILFGLSPLFAQLALAHPGHGPEYGHSNEVLHPFLGLDHVLMLAAIGALYLVARRGLLSRRNRHDDEE